MEAVQGGETNKNNNCKEKKIVSMYKKEGYWYKKEDINVLSNEDEIKKNTKITIDGEEYSYFVEVHAFDKVGKHSIVYSFPSLKKVPVKERKNWYLMGGGVTWDSCPEVIHIEQILGNFQNYSHEVA